jgi:hypothetical protein
MGQILSEYCGCPLFHYFSILIFSYMLLYPEGQEGDPGSLPRRNALLEIGDHSIEKYFIFFYCLKGKREGIPIFRRPEVSARGQLDTGLFGCLLSSRKC